MDERIGSENISKGFTQIPHSVFNALLLLDLNEREWKIVGLIIRLSYGCHRDWAKLKKYDLRILGIAPSHAKGVTDRLEVKQIVLQNKRTKEFRINEKYLASEGTKKVSSSLEKLGELIGKQLSRKTSQSGNQEVTELVTNTLPKEEVLDYQNGNYEGLPKEEVLASEDNGFATPKDILKKTKNSDIKDIAVESSSYKEEADQETDQALVDPHNFQPQTMVDHAAKEAWEKIEPTKPESFRFYLWAARKGLPTSKFFEFTSEITQDPSIDNPGAVFNKKVKDCLGGQDENSK